MSNAVRQQVLQQLDQVLVELLGVRITTTQHHSSFVRRQGTARTAGQTPRAAAQGREPGRPPETGRGTAGRRGGGAAGEVPGRPLAKLDLVPARQLDAPGSGPTDRSHSHGYPDILYRSLWSETGPRDSPILDSVGLYSSAR